MMRVLFWDAGALGVVLAALAAKQLLILAAVFSLHGPVVTDEVTHGVLAGVVMIARRRETGGSLDAPLPGLVAKD